MKLHTQNGKNAHQKIEANACASMLQSESSQTQSMDADEFREYIRTSLDAESLSHLNSRRFPDQTFWCIVLDGIVFGGSVVIVALGVDTAGNKHFPGISEGSTENADSALSLLRSIEIRDVRFTDRVLVVIDGSKALVKAASHQYAAEAENILLHNQSDRLTILESRISA